MFGVSSETVRRDLAELSRGKKIHKVHGGAIALRRPAREEDYSVRVKQNSEGKRCIGRYAASLLRDGDIVLFDSGATTEEIARSVFGLKDVTFITHSLNVASIFAEKRNAGDFSGRLFFSAVLWSSVRAIRAERLRLPRWNAFPPTRRFSA
jgi:DeoR/GlpR family transcriptional regulator of sugar metabolism